MLEAVCQHENFFHLPELNYESLRSVLYTVSIHTCTLTSALHFFGSWRVNVFLSY